MQKFNWFLHSITIVCWASHLPVIYYLTYRVDWFVFCVFTIKYQDPPLNLPSTDLTWPLSCFHHQERNLVRHFKNLIREFISQFHWRKRRKKEEFFIFRPQCLDFLSRNSKKLILFTSFPWTESEKNPLIFNINIIFDPLCQVKIHSDKTFLVQLRIQIFFWIYQSNNM